MLCANWFHQDWVNQIVERLIGETAPFGMDFSLRERNTYADLVVAHHSVHRALVLEDHALQVSNALLMEDTLSIAFTEFLFAIFRLVSSSSCNLQMPIEAEEYGLPKDGKTNK